MRIRSIKPEFWRSTDIARLPRDVRLLFIGLWSYVDDNGVGIDDHRAVSADLFGLEDDPLATREFVQKGLARLSRVSSEMSGSPLLVRYEVDGKRYLYITGWKKHQRVDRPANPRYPPPPEGLTSGNPDQGTEFGEDSRYPREDIATGTGEQGNRGTEEQRNTDSPDAPRRTRSKDIGPEFEAFWSNYPRKEAKAAARKAWPAATRKLEPDRLVKAADYWSGLWNDTGTPKEFIPYPATWLNGERWNDDPPVRRGLDQRPSTTDQRVAAAQALKAELTHQPLALPGGPT